MRVLITRPAPRAGMLAEKLRAINIESVIFSAVRIDEAPDPAAIKSIAAKLSHYADIIFISPIAVQQFARWVRKIPAGTGLYAVGKSTAQAIAEHGWGNAVYPKDDFHSEALLALPALQQVQARSLLICQGQGGNPLLAETLRLRGAHVAQAILYVRRMPEVAHLPDLNTVDVVISTSKESLRHLLQLFGHAILQKPLLVSSQKIQDFANMLGFNAPCWRAANATDDAIIYTLQTLQKQ